MATKKPKLYIETGEDNDVSKVKCTLCTNILMKPLTSKACGHSLCTGCIAVLYTKGLPDIDDVKCPVCKSVTALTEWKHSKDVEDEIKRYNDSLYTCRHCDMYTDVYLNVVEHQSRCKGGLYSVSYGGCSGVTCRTFGCFREYTHPGDHINYSMGCPMGVLLNVLYDKKALEHLFSYGDCLTDVCRHAFEHSQTCKTLANTIDRITHVFNIIDPTVEVKPPPMRAWFNIYYKRKCCDTTVSIERRLVNVDIWNIE